MRVTVPQRRKRKRRGFYTLLILPHSRNRFRKLHVSRGFVLTVGALALLLVGGALVAPHLLLRTQTQEAALDRLARENLELRREKEEFDSHLEQLSTRLHAFESQASRIAEALGVDDLPVSRPAAGGPGEGGLVPGRGSPIDGELSALRGRADHLDVSLDQLGEAFEERMRLLSSTPNVMPAEGWFSHGFGWRKDPFTGRRQFHRGIDIVADSGAPVVATADGIISRAVRVPDYGKMVDISHGFGFVTRYGHMSEILVRPGQRVRRGDVLGRVGSTGRSTGPHVHYEIFRDGRRINPWKYLGQRGR